MLGKLFSFVFDVFCLHLLLVSFSQFFSVFVFQYFEGDYCFGACRFFHTFVRPARISQQPSIKFFWNIDWICTFRKVKNWHSWIFDKNSCLPPGVKRGQNTPELPKITLFAPSFLIHLLDFSENLLKHEQA